MESTSKPEKMPMTAERQVAVEEGQIQDLGTIALESVRIQYPQPKLGYIVIGNKSGKIPRSTLENI